MVKRDETCPPMSCLQRSSPFDITASTTSRTRGHTYLHCIEMLTWTVPVGSSIEGYHRTDKHDGVIEGSRREHGRHTVRPQTRHIVKHTIAPKTAASAQYSRTVTGKTLFRGKRLSPVPFLPISCSQGSDVRGPQALFLNSRVSSKVQLNYSWPLHAPDRVELVFLMSRNPYMLLSFFVGCRLGFEPQANSPALALHRSIRAAGSSC